MRKRLSKSKELKNKSKVATVELYSKHDYQRDEESFNKAITQNKPIDWSALKRLMIHDLSINNIIETHYCGNYSLEDINMALEHPYSSYQVLISTSDYLMRISPHYNRLNTYFSNMAVFNWGIDVYDLKNNYNLNKLKEHYFSLASQLEKMNLKHEFSKIVKVIPYQDVFYGVVFENGTDYFIQQIDHRMCKLCQIQDGLYNFKINLSSINPINIGAYPEYIQRAYINFKNGNISNWYMPPADKQICIKLNSHLTYPYPLLISIVRDIFDLDIYKKLKLQSARTDNYKAILVEVPIDKDTVDKPLLTPDTIGVFAEMNKQSMSDDIGLIHTVGSKGEAISFKDSNNTRNNVADATEDVYNSSGVSKEMFNGSSSGTALNNSIENDSGIMYTLYRQFERWINRYIKLNKYNKSNYKFSFYILDMTIYNRDKVIDRYLKQCQFGAYLIPQWLASLGMTPSKIEGAYVVQHKLFDFHNNMKPLSSSYTQTSNNEGGAPLKNDDELSDSGQKTRDSDANSKR